ncbi:hypothetical protein ZOSMA_201G00190 [Zostera marina]|uniref:Uncharacterized protein n=1 Tax=Zostera marina TaxID=29655 RepID=A0A0K9PLP2_ZOSMR|nr:hypothetical protein ZOSMA_201G00190 [Zostera marina]
MGRKKDDVMCLLSNLLWEIENCMSRPFRPLSWRHHYSFNIPFPSFPPSHRRQLGGLKVYRNQLLDHEFQCNLGNEPCVCRVFCACPFDEVEFLFSTKEKKPAESVAVRLMMMDMEEIILCHGDGPP